MTPRFLTAKGTPRHLDFSQLGYYSWLKLVHSQLRSVHSSPLLHALKEQFLEGSIIELNLALIPLPPYIGYT